MLCEKKDTFKMLREVQWNISISMGHSMSALLPLMMIIQNSCTCHIKMDMVIVQFVWFSRNPWIHWPFYSMYEKEQQEKACDMN